MAALIGTTDQHAVLALLVVAGLHASSGAATRGTVAEAQSSSLYSLSMIMASSGPFQ